MQTVSVVIPTRNESENLRELIPLISQYGYRIIVCDDSDDNTPEVAKSLGAKVVVGRRLGLAQAVLDGIDSDDSDYIIVMDADLQHPPGLLPRIAEQLDSHDLVVVSKHHPEAKDNLSWWRRLQSNLAVWLTHIIIPVEVSDPMAGYFGIRRKCFDDIPRGEYYDIDYIKADKISAAGDIPDEFSDMSKLDQGKWLSDAGVATKMIGIEAIGFKIGLELFTKAKWVSHSELPMHFAEREHGVSKGTAHSLQKHLWRLFVNSLNYVTILPKGSEEYFAFYEGTGWQKKWKHQIANIIKDVTGKYDFDDVLDVGCGSSPNINYIKAHNVVGIDINKEAIAWMHGYSTAKFRVGSLLQIPFSDKSFDCLTCIEIIEHLYSNQIDTALSELSRVVKDDGIVILATPNYASVLWNIVEHAQQFFEKGAWTSDHHTHFTRNKLTDLCAKHGLVELSYYPVMRNMDMVIVYRKIGEGK